MHDPPRQNGYRYERKHCSAVLTGHELEEMVQLHPALFREIHQRRFVNNIYFDTSDRAAYAEAIRGNTERLKVRVRWYGGLRGPVERPVLELKRKRGQVGKKEQFPLSAFCFDDRFTTEELQQVFAGSSLPEYVAWQLAIREPALVNCYARRYFESADGRFRITIDTELVYYETEPSGPFRLRGPVEDQQAVLEIKYDQASEPDVSRVIHGFPIRLTKSSKYVSGVLRSQEE